MDRERLDSPVGLEGVGQTVCNQSPRRSGGSCRYPRRQYKRFGPSPLAGRRCTGGISSLLLDISVEPIAADRPRSYPRDPSLDRNNRPSHQPGDSVLPGFQRRLARSATESKQPNRYRFRVFSWFERLATVRARFVPVPPAERSLESTYANRTAFLTGRLKGLSAFLAG